MKPGTQIEDFAQLLMDSNPQYIFWKDIHGVYLGCNKLYAYFCNLDSTTQIIGTTDFDYMNEEEAKICIAADQEVIKSGNSLLNFEEFVTNAHGESRWYSINKIVLKNQAGESVGVLGTMTDVTEIKAKNLIIERQAEELQERINALKHVNSKLELANIDLEQFAFSLSHDLQEPLRMIGGFAGLLEKKFSPVIKEEGNKYIRFIKEGISRMSSLISQILAYSKVDQMEIGYKHTPLQPMLDEVLKDLKGIIDQKQARVNIHLPTQEVLCQPARLKMLFQNLVSNGIKFNEADVPTVDINYEETETEWMFSVADNGIGINQHYKDTIFKPFKRLHSKDEFPGHGIGLSLCKRIAFLHQGSIHFLANESGGTTFSVTISKEPTSPLK